MRRRPNEDGTLRRVFVERARGNRLEIALAQRATHAYSEGGDLQVITLYDGERFEGIPGERRFRSRPLRREHHSGAAASALGRRGGARGTADRDLLASNDPAQRAELHWRLAFPIMALVLAFIAMPLARLRPRQGRYARVGFAILIFFVYINLAIAGKMWIARGTMPEWLGLWWVHGCVALLRRCRDTGRAARGWRAHAIGTTWRGRTVAAHEHARPLCDPRAARRRDGRHRRCC